MTRRFVPVPRLVVLAAVATLLTAPIASAQALGTPSPGATPANADLLSPAAFARLIQPTAMTRLPRINLLRQSAAAMTRLTQVTPVSAPQQASWAARHKKALVLTGVAVGSLYAFYALAHCCLG